ncbi:hypothetical protein GIB67_025921 [Kingdonia uniflora]|uniref:Transposase MuDR plant domain-containing protein n=1 Tax=Kingdonia uniflora TaxID=39325 RepID=A0A7J7NYZ6_9MAGN|nr:hypothetical protein GIB67_025921 [Kingdonia uniflora]
MWLGKHSPILNDNDLLDMWSYSDQERVGDVHFYFSLQVLDKPREVNEPNPQIYINVELIDDDTSEDDTFGDDTSTGENSGNSDSVYNEWVVHGYIGEQSDVEFEETQLRLVGPSLEVNEPNVGGEGLIDMLGGSETNNSGPSEPPLSEFFKPAKKLKKTKTNGLSEPPLENKSMKIVASKKRKSRDCGDTIRVWDKPLSERHWLKEEGTNKKTSKQTTQIEKELKEKKKKNKVGEPTKPTNKRAKPSDLPEEELDVLPVVYDSDGEIVIIEEVGQTENGARTGSGHQTEDIGQTENGAQTWSGHQTKDIGVDNTDEVEEWTRWAKLHPDSLDAEEGYYNTHTSLEDDGTPTQEDIDRLDEELRNFAENTQSIFFEEEDSTPINIVGRENDELTIGMVWTNVFEARKFIRNYAIINKFEYYQVKNEDYRLRYKCGDEK